MNTRDLSDKMRAALEPLPIELLDELKARCMFYVRELSSEEIMSLGKQTFRVFDHVAREAEQRRRAA